MTRPRQPRWVGNPIGAGAWALAAAIGGWMPGDATAATLPGRIIVKYHTATPPAKRAAVCASLGGHRLHELWLIGADIIAVDGGIETAIAAAERDPAVEYAEPDYEVRVIESRTVTPPPVVGASSALPNDPRFPECWGLHNTGQFGGLPGADIHAPEAWDISTGDATLKIGIIDTGIDAAHPDLAGNIWTNPGEIPGNRWDDDHNGYVDDVHGYDFYNDDGDPFDDYGHGAHVAGTIGATANDGVGVAGVCWQCKLVGIKFLSSGGHGAVTGAILALQYAVRVGCRVTNNSYGGAEYSRAWLDAIDAAGRAGVLFVAAAGNNGQDLDHTAFYPGGFTSPYVLTVAATTIYDELAEFSNYGATTVDLAAPGDAILSVRSGGGWIHFSGTSMATPHVTGVVALVAGRYPNLGPLQVKARILQSVDVLPALGGLCVSGGRLNAYRSVAFLDSIAPAAIGDLVVQDVGSTSCELQWTAPGDDGSEGRAFAYEVRYADFALDAANFQLGTAIEAPEPGIGGGLERAVASGLRYSTRYWFAVRAVDDYNNAGALTATATTTTLGAPELAATFDGSPVQLTTGRRATRTLNLRNSGAGRLEFTIPPARIALNPIPSPNRRAADRGPRSKNAPDPRRGAPVTSGFGGPDAYGYRWIDSDSPGGPSFAWDERGAPTQLLRGDEEIGPPMNLPFHFPFYGNRFDHVRVCTNGYLTFGDTRISWANQELPSSEAPANMIAPLWDDLDFRNSDRVLRIHSDPSVYLITWHQVRRYNNGGPFSFQVALYPSGDIVFRYRDIGPFANTCTVGMQNGDRSQGLTVAFNADYVRSDLAVRIGALRQWMTPRTTSGRISAGGSQDVEMSFDASGVPPGDYDATLVVESNAPQPEWNLPVHLHIEGAPLLEANTQALAFGSVFVGGSQRRTLRIRNSGSLELVVTSITGPPGISVDPAIFDLAPEGSQDVQVSFAPTATGPLTQPLLITSNALDAPTTPVQLSGNALPAPSFSVGADSLDVTLTTNRTLSRSLRLTNAGGSPFTFHLEPIAAVADAPAATAPVAGPPVAWVAACDAPKGAADRIFGAHAGSSGGPDRFGYRWTDSDADDGPAFDWIDIRSTGTRLQFGRDDENLGPFPIGFPFSFYGTSFNAVRICSNGWLSFTSTLASYANGALPNGSPTAPENLLAVLWDDWDLSAAGEVWLAAEENRLVVQFQDVVRHGGGDAEVPSSFEVQLDRNGWILYQYLQYGALGHDSATVGIQNAARDDGLTVAFNAPGVHDRYAVRITPPVQFLTARPADGSIPPGESLDIDLGFSAVGLRGGHYGGALRITGNDPLVPQFDLQAALTVIGVPDLQPAPSRLDFGAVDLGFPQIRQMQVRNPGSEMLLVEDITTSDAAYSVATTRVAVPPFGQTLVDVRFAPTEARDYASELQIHSNDPDLAILAIPLSGGGRVAPELTVTGGSLLVARVSPGGATARTLTLQNSGGSSLDYQVALRASGLPGAPPAARLGLGGNPPPAKISDPGLELAKGADDPGPGIRGTGGPDAFGYRWKDSDESGGPRFDWVDVSNTGTRLPLRRDDQVLLGMPLGFDFPFYGRTFRTINVCSNGWLSFTSTDSAYSNQPLPSTGSRVPRDLVAPFWDDLNLGFGGQIRSRLESDRCVIAWIDVPLFSTGQECSFEALLYRDGRIVFQYSKVPDGAPSATTGIQDAAGNRGLLVAYNSDYVRAGLALEIRDGSQWLAANAATGSLAPGASTEIMVHLDATDLDYGSYSGTIRITSNDPDGGLLELPVTLWISNPTSTAPALPNRLAVRLPRGNPARGSVLIEAAMPASGALEIDIFDVRGSQVRRLRAATLPAGWHPIQWDGRDGGGRPVAAGIYFVRLQSAGEQVRTRCVYLR